MANRPRSTPIPEDDPRELLQDLLDDDLEAGTAARGAFLLGSTYVAYGDVESAVAQFKLALARKPAFLVRPDEVSPTVRAAWVKAGGVVATLSE